MAPKSLQTKSNRTVDGGTDPMPRPGDYDLGSLESRAAARALLDEKFAGQQQRFRVNVSGMEELDLENTTCSRSPWPDGTVFELVMFNGLAARLTKAESEQLERWVRRIPINGRTYKFGEAGNG